MDVRLLFLVRQTTDKYQKTVKINVQQPAIVLMNPEDAGSLLARAQSSKAKASVEYWRKRATIYTMGTVVTDQFLRLTLERRAFL